MTTNLSIAKLADRIDWDRLAEEYFDDRLAAPVGVRNYRWRTLAGVASRGANRVRSTVRVFEVPVAEPYATAAEQSEDITDGVFQVSTLYCEHPVWTPAENVNFRIWHDVDGHHLTGAPFDRTGELQVLNRHATQVWDLGHHHAAEALFCEVALQLAVCIATGSFGPQRCQLLGTYGHRVFGALLRAGLPFADELEPHPALA